jgi:membrane associated rhomboid family serine protease
MQTTQASEFSGLHRQETSKEFEKELFYKAILKSVIIVSILWVVFLVNDIFVLNWNEYGMAPRTLQGLYGIFTMPFLHGDLKHLFSNSIPLLVLLFSLFYFFYKKSALILMMTCFMG